MSQLTRFMHTARAVLAEADRKASGNDRVPFFVRTTWMFVELEELATASEANIFMRIKVARLGKEVAALVPLLDLIDANTHAMGAGQLRHQRGQIVIWIKEQIIREASNAD